MSATLQRRPLRRLSVDAVTSYNKSSTKPRTFSIRTVFSEAICAVSSLQRDAVVTSGPEIPPPQQRSLKDPHPWLPRDFILANIEFSL